MRFLASAFIVTMLGIVPVAAQAPDPAQNPFNLDPFNPTDAAWLRNYGAALVAEIPLLELHKLDPYKPSNAALLRQIGGAIPLWGWLWYPAPAGPALHPFPTSGIRGEEVMPTEVEPGMPGAKVNEPLPPTTFDPARLSELSNLPQRAGEPRPRVCTVRMGNKVITC
jgi:hypothetical protein